MFSNIHHDSMPQRRSTFHLRLILTFLIVAVALAGVTAAQSRRLAAIHITALTASPSTSLDVAALGSARTLLIASFEAPTQALGHPVAECSPFGTLTACTSDHFAALGHVKLRLPA